MESPQGICSAALEALKHGETLLRGLTDAGYRDGAGAERRHSIGAHYRHCLDHFAAFIAGIDAGEINYDHRARNPQEEQMREVALERTQGFVSALTSLSEADLKLTVSVANQISYEAGDSQLAKSTLGRELMYVISHTIHHFALIRLIAEMRGIEMPAEFGVAPATIQHYATTAR